MAKSSHIISKIHQLKKNIYNPRPLTIKTDTIPKKMHTQTMLNHALLYDFKYVDLFKTQ